MLFVPEPVGAGAPDCEVVAVPDWGEVAVPDVEVELDCGGATDEEDAGGAAERDVEGAGLGGQTPPSRLTRTTPLPSAGEAVVTAKIPKRRADTYIFQVASQQWCWESVKDAGNEVISSGNAYSN